MKLTRLGLALAALAALATLGGACTRTIYVVQNADGTLTELAPEGDEADDTAVIVDDDVVEVELLGESDFVLVDGDGTVYVAVEVEGRGAAPVRRAPMNVALVIDRSGSMQGEKLAAARAAAVSLVDELADGDRVALVSYASDVSVELPLITLDRASRAALERAVAGLEAVGGTALAEALDAGVDALLAHPSDGGLDRVLLLSDGRPTVGETAPWALETGAARAREAGVSVTTLGIGVDYNDDLMTALAIAGGGNYYFVEHARELSRAVGRDLEQLGHTVARDVELTLRLPAGVHVKQVYGYRHEIRDDAVTVALSSLAAGERRRLLVALDVPARASGALTVAEARLSYASERRGVRRDVALPPVRVTYTDDPRRVRAGARRAVAEKVAAVKNAEARAAALDLLDRGEADAAAAVVDARLRATRAAEGAHGGAALAREVHDLEGLADEVEARPAPSSERYKVLRKTEKARAYDALMR